jgi:anti-sigma regulatory factor (Ser/Thr protein kinase)
MGEMRERGVDTEGMTIEGRLVMADAKTVLGGFMAGDLPQPPAFHRAVRPLLGVAGAGGRRVRAFGEMVSLLWDDGNVLGAVELERLWNGLLERLDFDLLCAYPLAIREAPESLSALTDVCGAHSQVFGAAPHSEQAERTGTFARSAESVRLARRFVAEVLAEWGQAGLIDDARLVVPELATNAIVHGRSDFTVGLSRPGAGLLLTVGDGGCGRPQVAEARSTDPGGRGLALVKTLCSGWGQIPSPIGKVVWVSLPATDSGRRDPT